MSRRGRPWNAAALRGSSAAVLAGALAVDALLGEPPEPVHPVVWMGRAVGLGIPPDAPGAGASTLVRGAAVVAAGVGVSAAAGAAAAIAVRRLPAPASIAAEAVALWPLLALRRLVGAAGDVRSALAAGDLDAARGRLRWLVGRDLDDLPAPLLASAAVESLAENLADAVVAPLLFARLAGVAGAAAHRFVNTADAMAGYRDGHRLGGRAAARLDDALNLAPARLSALAIAIAAPAGGGSPVAALRRWRQDGGITASPNAGRPMAAMAGALGVRLEKRGHHVLNARGRPCGPADIERASRITVVAAVLVAAVCALSARRRGRREGPHAA